MHQDSSNPLARNLRRFSRLLRLLSISLRLSIFLCRDIHTPHEKKFNELLIRDDTK